MDDDLLTMGEEEISVATTNTHKITRRGYENLKKELEYYETELPVILERLRVSKEMGDLSENGEYAEAKSSMNQNKIMTEELIFAISTSIPIDSLSQKDYIDFGAEVTIDIENKGQKTYVIVGELEGDIDKNRLSIQTLLAKAMLGKKLNSVFTFNNRTYKILSIIYDDKNVQEE